MTVGELKTLLESLPAEMLVVSPNGVGRGIIQSLRIEVVQAKIDTNTNYVINKEGIDVLVITED